MIVPPTTAKAGLGETNGLTVRGSGGGTAGDQRSAEQIHGFS